MSGELSTSARSLRNDPVARLGFGDLSDDIDEILDRIVLAVDLPEMLPHETFHHVFGVVVSPIFSRGSLADFLFLELQQLSEGAIAHRQSKYPLERRSSHSLRSGGCMRKAIVRVRVKIGDKLYKLRGVRRPDGLIVADPRGVEESAELLERTERGFQERIKPQTTVRPFRLFARPMLVGR